MPTPRGPGKTRRPRAHPTLAFRGRRGKADREAASAKFDADALLLELREANQQLVIASLHAQKLTEEAHKANRVKDDFLATVSHELRTPLTAVIGWAHVLQLHQVKPERVDHAIATIERNAAALGRLIEDLLDVSRITAGTMQVESKPLNLVSLVEAEIETARHIAADKDVQLQLHAPDTLAGEPIMGDARRLQQVVGNLLSNAIKFTARGGRVDVQVRRADEYMELRVSDTGKGVSAEFLPFMFDRFRMADVSPTRRDGGLGLGLAIVRQIVELHRGQVRAESAGLDRGTIVTVTLPALQEGIGTLMVDGLQTEHAAPDGQALAGVTVLLVEDHDDERELISLVLQAAGATVAGVGSASEALASLDQVQPDVLVSDIALPDQDGHMLIRQLRSQESERGGFLPSIAITGFTRAEDRAAAIAAGFQAYVAKPAAPADLTRAITAVVPREPRT